MPTNAWSPPVDDFSRYIADHVPGRIAYWDRQLRCQFINRVFCEWFGKTHDDVIGRHIVEIFDAQRVASIHRHLEGALRGEVQIFDYEEARADGVRTTMQLRYDPDIQDGEVQGFFVLALDVTLQREAERRLQRLNAELELERDKARASAMAKSRFLANMSHEIRTPLNAIIGLTHLLQRDPGASQAPARLAQVSEAAERLLAMVNDVLDLSKIETGTLVLAQVDFDLYTLIDRAIGLVDAGARAKSLVLTADVASLPRLLRGDATRLSQALAHLLANAVKLTERGSVALVGTLLQERGEALQVRFEVRDTGIGIAADRLDSIFDPFEQGDGSATRRFGGSGLGLGITRHLAQLMGGDAGVTSELGVGSSFWITVALQRIDAHAGAASAGSGPFAGRRALVVDDMAEALALFEPMLRRLGLQVELAASGAEALAAARAAESAGRPHDVLLIDWLMPHMDGLETARRLLAQARGKPPKCILVSISADERMREQALALGITCLLKKPVSYSTLNDHLMSLLGDEPGASRRSGSEHAQAERSLREAHAGATVLVAEDNPVNQDVARTLLNMAGLHADIAHNGREAVEMAMATSYPLVLMDVQMPELDGLEAARRLRAQPAYATTPIIAMTANAHADDRAACIAAGMNDHLTKPVDATVLYAVLRRWLSAADVVPGTAEAAAEAAPRKPRSLSDIEGLNAVRGLAFLGGNDAAFRRTLLTMVELYAGGLPEARAYLAQTPSPATIGPLRQALHSVGGACAALGLESLSEGASRLGGSLREGSAPDAEIEAGLRAFMALLGRVLGEIRDHLS